jgi:hypothetical protein
MVTTICSRRLQTLGRSGARLTLLNSNSKGARWSPRSVHGRVEIRRLQVTTVAGLDFPHAIQAIRITRRVRSYTAAAGAP